MTSVWLFPGQSSRDPGMFERIVRAWPPAAPIMEQASELLGRDLRRHFGAERGEAMFDCNRHIQVGVFLCSYLHQRALEARGKSGALSLGLSLGEYNHLVHIGALAFEEALRLVDARGAAYDRGPRGMMVAVFPLELEELEPLVAAARERGVVEISNYNSPTQHVLSGEAAAVEAAAAAAEEEAFAQTVVIADGLPMHCSLFQPVAEAFRPCLERARWRQPDKPYIPNLAPALIDRATPSLFVDYLARQVANPVQWQAAVELVGERFPDAAFTEVGPKAVLFQMLKRWRDNPRFKTDGGDGAGLIVQVEER